MSGTIQGFWSLQKRTYSLEIHYRHTLPTDDDPSGSVELERIYLHNGGFNDITLLLDDFDITSHLADRTLAHLKETLP
jgi:hypothetical protein